MKKMIAIRLTDEVLAVIDERAKAEGLNRTELIEKAIGVYTNKPTVYTKPVETASVVYTGPKIEEIVYTDAVAERRGKVTLPTVQPKSKPAGKSAWGHSDKLIPRRG